MLFGVSYSSFTMSRYYNIVPFSHVPISRDQFFTYAYDLEQDLVFGDVVQIPLGKKEIYGVVLSVAKNPDKSFAHKVKKIISVLPSEYRLTEDQLFLAKKIHTYYISSLGEICKMFVPPYMKRPPKRKNEKATSENALRFTAEQLSVFNKIKELHSSKHFEHALLHGPTGSGKTELYLQFADLLIKEDKQVLVLIPEISLVPQTISRFENRFGSEAVSVLHSKISNGEKYREWQRIRNGNSKIIIGPRSALFAPFNNLGGIIIDESHDGSFKQYDKMPRYDARVVAEMLCKKRNILLLEGTATPLVSTYSLAKSGKIHLLELTNRIHQENMPLTFVINMKDEFKKKNYSVFSEKLHEEILHTLSAGKQVLLYVNRRGAASYVTCRSCGYVEECDDCDLPFTYHIYGDFHGLICHHCGKKAPVPVKCPECKSSAIKYLGGGTQKVFSYAQEEFDEYRVERMDKDTTQNKHDHKNIYTEFAAGDIDILIGTQMITKGWDISNVGLVGIISADIGLNFPDFRSSEHVFQQLVQVAGRTGRGDDRGKVIVQTYYPENQVINSVKNHNFSSFFDYEINNRKELLYPPFSSLFKIEIQDMSEEKAFINAEKAVKVLKKELSKNTFSVQGPAPSFFHKVNGKYKFHIIIKSPLADSVTVEKVLHDNAKPDWRIDRDPVSVL